MVAAHVLVRTQVHQTDVPADYVTNSLYFETDGTAADLDFQNLAQHVSDVFYSGVGFGGTNPWTYYSGRGGDVRAYNLADPKPRPIRGHVTHTPTTWEGSALGPRLLALCLSYYSGRNLPHTRGRIYIGPLKGGDTGEVADAFMLGRMMDLAKGLYNIASQGPLSWAHATHSTVTGQTNVVSNYWANDVWDVQHSRAHKELTRVKYP